MKRLIAGLSLAGLAAAGLTSMAPEAANGVLFGHDRPHRPGSSSRAKHFQRVSTFAGYRNNGTASAAETVSEIVAVTADGKTLIYTDAIRGTVGLIDISDPARPQPGGVIPIDTTPSDDVDFTPTSVAVLGNRYALVAVDASVSKTSPDGVLLVIDLSTRTTVNEIPLNGQPDAVKISPDGLYAAIVVENERNEDLCVGGSHDGAEVEGEACAPGGGLLGGLPQTAFGNPPGHLGAEACR